MDLLSGKVILEICFHLAGNQALPQFLSKVKVACVLGGGGGRMFHYSKQFRNGQKKVTALLSEKCKCLG